MATTLALVGEDGTYSDSTDVASPIKQRINAAREWRKQFEGDWHLDIAFASGQHNVVWDRFARTLRQIQDVDPRYQDIELYSIDLITERRMTVLGELGSEDDRPELLLQREDKQGEEFQAQVNRALGYAWDFEADADEALAEADRLCIDMGTSAIRCRFDPDVGKSKGEYPHYQGKPLMDEEKARELMSQYGEGPIPGVTMRETKEGRICWEPLSSFCLLPPPGVTHERYFPHETIVRPTLLTDVQAEYGEIAADLREDGDIASTMGTAIGTGQDQAAAMTEGRDTRLRGHIWLFQHYERPSEKYPKGRVFHFAGNGLRLLRIEEELPYVGPDGTYRSGIAYFHWLRTSGRFFSRSLIRAMRDPQCLYNKRHMQTNEIIDRGLPYVLAQEGTEAERQGSVMEIVRYRQGTPLPTPVQGIGPGPWMQQEMEQIMLDMDRASGVRAPTLGENPTNVSTYSQLALIKQADLTKRQPPMRERKMSIAQLVEDTVWDMRHYWGSEKQIMLAGDDERVQAETFNASQIPDFFVVKVAKGAPKPRDQAANLQMITDIWNGSITSRQPLPVEWLKESYEAGEPMELPSQPANEQIDKAQLENHALLLGQQVPVAYYDPPEIHIPIHREAQIQAELVGDEGAVARIEAHVQEHKHMAEMNALQQAQQTLQNTLAQSQPSAGAQQPPQAGPPAPPAPTP